MNHFDPIARRAFLTAIAGCTAYALLNPKGMAESTEPRPGDDEFLDDLSRRSFRFFWEQSDPHTGITRDRARTDGREYPKERRDIGSTGVTGFCLTALCIGAERK